MKQIKLETPITIYESVEELPTAQRQAMEYAAAALKEAYAPYSNFFVGAAALLENGQIVKGANQENAAYPMCLCAERVALGTVSMQYPGIAVKLLAITIKNPRKSIEQPAAPCGSCRQAICELEQRQGQPISILLRGETGPIWEIPSGASILPLGFNNSFL